MVALVAPSHVVVWRWEQAMTYAAELRLHFLSPGDRRQFITRIARLIDIWRLRDKVSTTRRGLYVTIACMTLSWVGVISWPEDQPTVWGREEARGHRGVRAAVTSPDPVT